MKLDRRQFLARYISNALLAAGGTLIGVSIATAAADSSGPPRRQSLPVGTLFDVSTETQDGQTATGTSGATASQTGTNTRSPRTATGTFAAATASTPTLPAAAPTPPPDDSPLARLVIPSIKVEAPIVYKGVDRNGVMEAPDTWYEVAYYKDSGRPGFGSGNNVIFGGHVDFYPNRTAVFWDLRKLKPGDQVKVALQNGHLFTYAVVSANVYQASAFPSETVFGPTHDETATLYTCDGTFDGLEYDKRLVVRAVRVPDGSVPTG